MAGRLRVGRSTRKSGKINIPSWPEFTPIVVLTKTSSPYGELGPYHLKNTQGQILENVWQFSKVYAQVPSVTMPYSSGNSTIVWQWPAETHVEPSGQVNDQYFRWRLAGKFNKEPVRAPVGWKSLKKCLFALEKDEPISDTNPKLDYITSRKRIYLPIYMREVIKEAKFQDIKNRWLNGENLLIIEVDGPHAESLPYYKEKYKVDDNFIVNDSMPATEPNLSVMLNDDKHPFGHGYCLAWTLLQSL